MTKQTFKGVTVMVMAIVMMLFSASIALAQQGSMEEESPRVPYCGELSDADCELLVASQEAMAELTSAVTEQVTELYAEGLPGLPADRISIRFGNTLTFVADPAVIDQYGELRAMSPDELVADPEMLEAAMMMPYSINMDQVNLVEFSPELASLLSSMIGINLPTTVSYRTIMVNGVLYIRIGDLADMLNLPAFLGEWIGIDVRSLAPMMMEDQLASGEIDADALEAMLTAPGQAMSVVLPMMAKAENAPYFPSFMEQLRLRDSEIDGEPVANYRLTWDSAAYFTSPFFAVQLGKMMQGDAGESTAPSGTTVKALQMMGLVTFSNLNVQMSQSIGAENSYVYESETVMDWGLPLLGNPSRSMPAMGVSVTTANSQFDAVAPIEAPSDALVLPIAMLLNLFQNMR